MSYTKEPWKYESEFCTAIIYGPKGENIAASTPGDRPNAHDDYPRAVACINACANLPEPEKNIRELVAWARTARRWFKDTISGSGQEIGDGLEKTLKPFEKKNERPLD